MTQETADLLMEESAKAQAAGRPYAELTPTMRRLP